MVNRFLVAAVLVAGCATQPGMPERIRPGLYPNYRVMVQGEIYRVTRDEGWADCAGKALVANLTPAELDRLDKYARGEVSISNTEMRQIDSDLMQRFGGREGKEAIRPYCPDKVDSFHVADQPFLVPPSFAQ